MLGKDIAANLREHRDLWAQRSSTTRTVAIAS